MFKEFKTLKKKKTHSTNVASITDLPVEVDKALIEADVSLQNVDAWAKKSLESGTVQLDTLERSLGGHRSSSRPFIQQSDLPKVVRGSELTTSLVSSPSAGHWVTIAFPSMMMKNSSPWSP